MDTRNTSASFQFWKCSYGHQNSTEVSAEERKQGAILLKCWVAGCTAQKVIPGRVSPSRIGDRSPRRGVLARLLSRS